MQFHAATESSVYTISGAVNVHTPSKKMTPRIKWSRKGGKKKTMENYQNNCQHKKWLWSLTTHGLL